MKIRISLPALVAVLALAPVLSAQEVHFGGQATLAMPNGDLGNAFYLDKELGFGVGAHAFFGFKGGHALVPRLDYAFFEREGPDRTVQMLTLGLDYTYYVSGEANRGFYFGVGAAFGQARFEATDLRGVWKDSPTGPQASVLAGCMFTRHFGAEVRYNVAEYQPELLGMKPELSCPTATVSLIARF